MRVVLVLGHDGDRYGQSLCYSQHREAGISRNNIGLQYCASITGRTQAEIAGVHASPFRHRYRRKWL